MDKINLAETETALAALAEALRAFIGEPCHCAGGMHWSPERGYFHCNGIVPEA